MLLDAAETPSTVIAVRRTIRAPRARVFAAWTSPDDLRRWWRATSEHTPAEVTIDLRVGGSYRLGMRAPSGIVHVVSGTYREISPPARLVYTWRWIEPDLSPTESIVTVEFIARGAATEVVIAHAGLSEDARKTHAQGWTGCCDALMSLIAGERS